MQRLFPSNDNKERALVLLSSYAPDSVDDFFELFQGESRASIEAKLRVLRLEDSGLPSCNAMYSRDNLTTFEDFYYVYLGMSCIVLENLKTQQHGEKEYSTILQSLFNIPKDMADKAASSIETYDVLSGSDKEMKMSWYEKLAANMGEYLRQAANWTGSLIHLPWHIEESQDYDIDGLYEISLLGKAVEALSARVRLMGSQMKISTSLGLNWVASAGGQSGSTADQLAAPHADPLSDILSIFKPFLSGGGLGKGLLGGLNHIQEVGHGASAVAAKQIANDNEEDGDVWGLGDISQMGDLPIPTQLVLAGGRTPTMNRLLQMVNNTMIRDNHRMALDSKLRDDLGDVFGDAYADGDVATMMTELGEIYSTETTGDPALDQAIAHQVMQQHMAEGGDVAEQGGLFMKLRTRHQMNKARRRQRRALKKANLDWARDFANTDFNAEAHDYLQDQHSNDPTNVYEPDGAAGASSSSSAGEAGEQSAMDMTPTSSIDMSTLGL